MSGEQSKAREAADKVMETCDHLYVRAACWACVARAIETAVAEERERCARWTELGGEASGHDECMCESTANKIRKGLIPPLVSEEARGKEKADAGN
jgi:hypothetical protein